MQLRIISRTLIVRAVIFLIFPLSLFGCAGAEPEGIDPPPHSSANTAQVSVKQKFRVVGGGSGQTHDLFDIGTGIEYNASVPTDNTNESHLVRMAEAVSPKLFEDLGAGGYIRIRPDPSESRFIDLSDLGGENRHYKIVDHFDDTLLGRQLFRKVDMNRGGALTDAQPFLPFPYTGLNDAFLSDPRGRLTRIKMRMLYDAEDNVLYRFITETRAMCVGNQLADNFEELTALHSRMSGQIKALDSRPDDFLIWELCGLVAPFTVDWNAHYVGSFPGFSLMTWERPPGTMRLYGVIGHQRTYASPLQVEAGAQYIGVYDPNRSTFNVEPYQRPSP